MNHESNQASPPTQRSQEGGPEGRLHFNSTWSRSGLIVVYATWWQSNKPVQHDHCHSNCMVMGQLIMLSRDWIRSTVWMSQQKHWQGILSRAVSKGSNRVHIPFPCLGWCNTCTTSVPFHLSRWIFSKGSHPVSFQSFLCTNQYTLYVLARPENFIEKFFRGF